jgi:DNA repair protein RadC
MSGRPRHSARRRAREDALIARAITIATRRISEAAPRYQVDGVESAKRYLQLILADRDREAFWVVCLDQRRRVLGAEELFRGTLTRAAVWPREIVRAALRHNAAGVLIAHNHPAAGAEFSSQDRDLTDTIRETLRLIDCELVDHLLVAGAEIVSLAAVEAAEEAEAQAHELTQAEQRRAALSAAAKAAWARRKAARESSA